MRFPSIVHQNLSFLRETKEMPFKAISKTLMIVKELTSQRRFYFLFFNKYKPKAILLIIKNSHLTMIS